MPLWAGITRNKPGPAYAFIRMMATILNLAAMLWGLLDPQCPTGTRARFRRSRLLNTALEFLLSVPRLLVELSSPKAEPCLTSTTQTFR